MAWSKKLTELNNILTNLYPIKDQSYRIIEMAGIPTGNISFKDAAKDNWYYILKEADKRNKVVALVQIAFEEYPGDDKLKSFLKTVQLSSTIDHENGFNLDNTIKELKLYLSNARLEVALEKLDILPIKDITFKDQINQLNARLIRLKADYSIDGRVLKSEYDTSLNQIHRGTLILINSLPTYFS